jgi:hypothetical protein
MRKDWLELVDQGVFQKHGEYLSDIQRKILQRCYDNPRQTYEEIAAEEGYTTGYINLLASQLWQLLSDVFGKEVKVTKTNLRGAVERFIEPYPPSSKPLKSFKIFISDRSQNTELSAIEQLRSRLNQAGQTTIIAEDWLQHSDEELNECICFLLIVSSHSANDRDTINVITQEVQKARELRESRQDQTLAILLIHANSCMSLPLNHPLIQEFYGIRQLELDSLTDLSTLVEEIRNCLNPNDEPLIPPGLISLIHNLLRLKISDNWMLTYVGEDQLLKLNEFVNALRNDNDTRKIQSCYSYWGVSPTQMWTIACSDPTYHMRQNLLQFPHNARQLAHHVDREQYNFVSLGVGEGSKDSSIISDFFNRDGSLRPRDDFLYLPVDMSLDMLRVAIGNIQKLPSHRRIAIQRDIETEDGMREIAYIANVLGENKPILYGFIGNTIANVDKPKQVLRNIVQVMKPEDLLLFEAQIIDDSALEDNRFQQTIQSVRGEYQADNFQRFALSALLQNSDLSIEPRERNSCYLVEVSRQSFYNYGRVLQIDCWFQNNTDRTLFLTFPTGAAILNLAL